MTTFVLTIIAFAGAMGIPAFLTAIVESAAPGIRPSSVRAELIGMQPMKFVAVNGRTPPPAPYLRVVP